MKKFQKLTLISLLILGPIQSAIGQELKSLALENLNPSIQADTVLLINISPAEPNFCGIRVEWGDGNGQDYRLERAGSEPIKLTKRYNRSGDFTIVVKGKFLSRGLKSAVPCKSENLILPIKVVDQEQQRQKAEIDRVSEQLKIEAVKRQELELRLREEQLKQKELALKQTSRCTGSIPELQRC